MTKKDFSGALRKTSASQKQAIDERFAKADSVLLGMKPVEAAPAAPAAEPAAAPETAAAVATAGPAAPKAGLAPGTKPPKKQIPKNLPPPVEAPPPEAVIRDTFSMPPAEHALIERLRVRAAREGRNTGKSEIVRAGLKALMSTKPAELVELLNGLQKVKPGRR